MLESRQGTAQRKCIENDNMIQSVLKYQSVKRIDGVDIYIYIYVCVCMCMHVCMYVHACMYVC